MHVTETLPCEYKTTASLRGRTADVRRIHTDTSRSCTLNFSYRFSFCLELTETSQAYTYNVSAVLPLTLWAHLVIQVALPCCHFLLPSRTKRQLSEAAIEQSMQNATLASDCKPKCPHPPSLHVAAWIMHLKKKLIKALAFVGAAAWTDEHTMEFSLDAIRVKATMWRCFGSLSI